MGEKGGRNGSNVIVGFALLAFGVFFLVGQFLRVNFWEVAWPLFVIVPGLMFFVGMVLGGKSVSGLAIPGSIVTSVGLILLYQNTFNHWTSWAYIWALIFPTSVGVGLMIQGIWGGDQRALDSGKNMAAVGVVIFLVAGTFFELVLNISGWSSGGILRFAWPVLLVVIGAYLLVKNAVAVRRDGGNRE
ncbi:MAG: hypothetical protein ACYC5M_00895 [Anaerolineae bacterium]